MNTSRFKFSSLRWPLVLPALAILLAVLGYSVWWVKLADNIEGALLNWQQKQAEKGLIVSWENLERGGFPYRLEFHLEKPALDVRDSETPITWVAEGLTAQMLAYKPNHVIMDMPGAQTLTYTEKREGTIQQTSLHLLSETFWASFVREDHDQRVAIDIGALSVTRQFETESPILSGTANAERLQAHVRPTPESESLSFDAALKAENVAWDDFGETPWAGTEIALLEAQLRLSDLPDLDTGDPEEWLRAAAQSGTKLSISDFQLQWGPIDMKGRGEVTLDSKGRPEGQFRTSVGNLPALIEALIEEKIMSRQSANLAFAGLTALSSLQGEENGRVRLPVAMKEGVLFLGPVAAGRLQPLY